jgi:hypothetical protein
MPADNGIRIAVGERGGRRSSTWRIWFGPKDIYAGFRTLGGIRKASIHYPRPRLPTTVRYIGYTLDYAKTIMSAREITREMRTHVQWPGAEIAPDLYVEFRFRIPESGLRPLTETDDDLTVWLKPPPAEMGTEVTILSGPAGYSGKVPARSDGKPNRVPS